MVEKNKEEILFHFENSIDFVRKLEEISEENWRTPIAIDKWSIAEIIGHLTPWDEFLLNKRIPYLLNNIPIQKGPNVEELNQDSAAISSKRSKKEIITFFINTRRSLIITINNIDEELWNKELNIGESSLSLYDYLKTFVEHDLHHFEQISKLIST